MLARLLPFNLEEGPWWNAAAEAFGVASERLGLFQFVFQPAMRENIFTAHRRAFDAIHAGPGDFPVGLTLDLLDIQSAEGGEDQAAEFRQEMSDTYLERLGNDDFVGVQTYSRMVVGHEGVIPPGEDVEKNQNRAHAG